MKLLRDFAARQLKSIAISPERKPGSQPRALGTAEVYAAAQSFVTVFFIRASTMAFSVHSLPMPGSSGVTKRPFTG